MANSDDEPIRLRPQRDGFVVGGTAVDGFPDLPELSREERLKVARWAQRLAAASLTDYQRLLLEVHEDSAANARATEELAGYSRNLQDLLELHEQGLIDQLTPDQQQCLAVPASHPKLRDGGYPLGVGDLRELTGATERQIRHWADIGLLPNHRIANRRSFYSGALARAFLLADAEQYEKSAVAALTQGGEQATRVARLIASALLAGARDIPPQARDEVTKAARLLLKHSGVLGEQGRAAAKPRRRTSRGTGRRAAAASRNGRPRKAARPAPRTRAKRRARPGTRPTAR